MRLLASYVAALRHAHKSFARITRPNSTSSTSTMATDVPMKDETHPHQVHHDYTWLTAKTAANHTLHEICKTFGCTEQGAKNAMSRRSITHCADWTHKDGPTWEKKEVKKRPAPEHPIDFLVGKRVFDDGVVQYKVKWSNLDEDQATWEPIPHLTHAKQAISEYEESHPNAPKA